MTGLDSKDQRIVARIDRDCNLSPGTDAVATAMAASGIDEEHTPEQVITLVKVAGWAATTLMRVAKGMLESGVSRAVVRCEIRDHLDAAGLADDIEDETFREAVIGTIGQILDEFLALYPTCDDWKA